MDEIDLSELANAPFVNPCNDPKEIKFKLFLENQLKKGFTDPYYAVLPGWFTKKYALLGL